VIGKWKIGLCPLDMASPMMMIRTGIILALVSGLVTTAVAAPLDAFLTANSHPQEEIFFC